MSRVDTKIIKIYADLVDQGKELPGIYSHFNPAQLRELLSTQQKEKARTTQSEYPLDGNEAQPSDDASLEKERILEAAQLNEKHEGNVAVIHSKEDATNPLGEIQGNVSLVIMGDLHYAPSDPEERAHEEALFGYFPLRAAQNLQDSVIQKKHFSGVKGEISPTKENVHIRWIIKETARHLFTEWLGGVVVRGDYSPESQETTPIVLTMGDTVHAGAFFGDQLGINGELRMFLDDIEDKNPKLKPKLMEIYGNHDEDARLPESFTMLSELYGHRVFTQEVGGNVLIAVLDTNIENPGWLELFKRKADAIGLEALKARQEIQAQVIEKIKSHNGAVVIVGHHLGRIVEKLAVETNILQSSNVQAIIAAHVHMESHNELPFRNKKGEKIALHTLESVISMEGSVPKSPKAYSIDITNGKVGPMRTLRQPQDQFNKAYELRVSP